MSCQNRPLPAGFVSREVDHAVMGNYMKKKYPVLSKCAGRPDTMSIYCTTKVFGDLLNAIASNPAIPNRPNAAIIKMYFATYYAMPADSGIEDLPSSYLGTTTLIFVPVDDTPKDIEEYYIIHPFRGVVQISKDLANAMVVDFKTKKVPALQEVAFSARPGFVESDSVWLELAKLNDPDNGFLGELEGQEATGVTIHLGAFPVDDIYISPVDKSKTPIGLQLTLILLPTKKCTYEGQDYYYYFDIEDTPGFSVRCKNSPPMFGGGNTFNPCPPAKTGCTSSIGDAP